MAGRILVVQHAPLSNLGVYGDVLDELGDEQVWLRCHEGDSLPADGRGFAGVVSLGAATSVNDGGPAWLHDELRLLRRCVEDGTPVFGICFGAQTLAAALGARVWRGGAPEVGIETLRLTPAAAADPVFAGLPEAMPMFHWHGDSFDLPEGAVRLAGSDAYENQAFRAGTLAYGVQFHAEATAELVQGWIDLPDTRAQLEQAGGPGAADRLLAATAERLGDVNAIARRLMAAWRAAA